MGISVVGPFEGSNEGATEGLQEGRKLGCCEGPYEGQTEGPVDGFRVGMSNAVGGLKVGSGIVHDSTSSHCTSANFD